MTKATDPNKPRRRHSSDTIKKMSEKRRARTTQPRSGTSKKADNLYKQLKKDYKGHPQEEKVLKWIEENKHLLNESADDTKARGIHCDYHEQYHGIYEVKISDVIYGNKVGGNNNDDEEPEEEFSEENYNDNEHEVEEDLWFE